ncbi:MAG TPA: glycine cleavage system aminomethyltransferase GcvT [Devosiaceae bacterium]|jgi:aminomethyltransferase|nr:glycine cleavage system aminomethyltransferase GcvT [Devosiaceae bacterium]
MADTAEDLKQVLLDERHRALGGRMVPFAGYALPLQYAGGIVAEHLWTRDHAGLFDVSHMGPAFLSLAEKSGNADADHAAIARVVEPLVCGDILGLKPGQVRYTLLLNDAGGILDDLMIARPAEPGAAGDLYIVVNAGTKDADFARISEAAGGRATLRRADHCALLALQGPEAAAVLEGLLPACAELGFMQHAEVPWRGATLTVSRSGYTGEDGFEILAPPDEAQPLFDALLSDERVRPIGLGARDSLRLEAGLPLYGHDLDDTVSPVEAGLNFALSRRRREAADFPGAGRILGELADGPSRLRVGIRFDGRLPAREGAPLVDETGRTIGRVTSGGFSPTLEAPIALAFLPPEAAGEGARVTAMVRDRPVTGTVVELPFVPHRYVRKARP